MSVKFGFQAHEYHQEFRLLLKLAVPILLAQLALTGLGVVDTVMSGRVGTNDLAAIGLGSSILFPIFMLSVGILLALTPLVSKANGKDDCDSMTRFLHQAIWLSIPLGLLTMLLSMKMDIVLNGLSLSPEVYQLTNDYLFYVAFGLPAIALYQAFRFFWEGLGLTLPTMFISFIALILNIPLNAIFIYGWGPVEAYGAAGCGIATSIVMWLMVVFGLGYAMWSKNIQPLLQFKHFQMPSWQGGIQDLLKLGIPNTLALLFEVSLFSLVAVFIAKLGAVVIASHQVAISYTSMAFMIPLSMGMALTVRAGLAYGKQSLRALTLTSRVGVGAAALFSGLVAVFTYVFMYDIVALYTQDNAVVQLAAVLLLYAVFYQVFDAVQVSTAGILRGLHNTKVIMWVTFISYWVLGLGLGWVMAFTDWVIPAAGVEGFWIGIVLGLTLAAILLQIKLRLMVKQLVAKGELVA